MTLYSTNDSSSILEDGKLKSGVYMVRNIQTETFLDIEVHTREVCCRPANDLGKGRGFWEIKSLEAGYTAQFVEPGKPKQFCMPPEKLGDVPLVVAPYPMAWRVEVVDDAKHRGFEYVRFCWETTNWVWTLRHASKDNGAKVCTVQDDGRLPNRIWKLIPAEAEGVFPSLPFCSSSLPPYDGDATGQSSARTQHVESEHDEFGTIIKEVTVVTTTSTVTTHKKYRVEDA